jgi:hypothetical protein
MSRIKNNLTGDVFEAPARDFANEPDFTIVDSSTPITADAPPVAVSAPGESDTPVSAPAEQASSGSTDTLGSTPSSGQASTQTDASPSSSSDLSTTPLDGTVMPDDVGNDSHSISSSSEAASSTDGSTNTDASTVDASTPQQSDSTSADASTPVNTAQPPVTDSVNGAPTGGPTAGNGATLDAKGKHIVADQLESDLRFAFAQLVSVGDHLTHAAKALFDQLHSHIDAEAAK